MLQIGFLIIAICFALAGSRLEASGPRMRSLPATDTFAQRLEEAVTKRDHYSLNVAMIEALDDLTPDNLEAAIAVVKNSSDKVYRIHAVDNLVRYWAEFAPRDAIHFCFSDLTEEERLNPLRTALFVWARSDAEGAIAWAEGNVVGKYKHSFFQPAINGWALTDLGAATEYVRTMDVGVDRDAAIRAIAKAHLHSGVDAYEKWFSTLDDRAERKKALDYSARWVRFDPELSQMLGSLKERLSSDGTGEKTEER